MADSRRSSARFLAPLALALCAVAVLAVVASSGVDDAPDGKPVAGDRSGSKGSTRTEKAPVPLPATYTVKTGDTLGAIAEQTGVSVERLQELNPQLDPQALVSGQMITLRE
jgi:LysM repeat protein